MCFQSLDWKAIEKFSYALEGCSTYLCHLIESAVFNRRLDQVHILRTALSDHELSNCLSQLMCTSMLHLLTLECWWVQLPAKDVRMADAWWPIEYRRCLQKRLIMVHVALMIAIFTFFKSGNGSARHFAKAFASSLTLAVITVVWGVKSEKSYTMVSLSYSPKLSLCYSFHWMVDCSLGQSGSSRISPGWMSQPQLQTWP